MARQSQSARIAALSDRVAELEAGERQYRQIVEASPMALILHKDGRIFYANRAAALLFGAASPEKFLTKNPLDLVHPDYHDLVRERIQRVVEFQEEVPTQEIKFMRFDGSAFIAEAMSVPSSLDGKSAAYVVLHDITERKQAEEKLAEANRYLRGIFDSAKDSIFTIGLDRTIQSCNTATTEMLGYSESEIVGDTTAKFYPSPADYEATGKAIFESMDEKGFFEGVRELRRADGTLFPAEIVVTLLESEGERKGIVAIIKDITKRKEIESALKVSEERYRTQYTFAPVMMHSIDMDGRLLSVTDLWLQTLGYEREVVIGRMATDFLTEKDRQRAFDEVLPRLYETGSAIDVPYQFVTKTGELIDVVLSAIMQKDANGENERSLSVLIDVTEQKQAEERLRQAQKMEAVGQLTGGIAHEFNNLLAVIIGNLEFAQDKDRSGQEVERYVERAMAAADRSAALTQRLLAFSRKQSLRPRAFDLNELKPGLLDLLRPALGETIQVEILIAHDLWPVSVDPEQIKTAILSLSINARDAMPAGGRLTIDAANVRFAGDDRSKETELEPGDYVLLSVTDTGDGMPPEVMERAFEPFYTTKEVGHGTGLGLSVVHGFVKQSGGHVEIASEVGGGTTVEIYLPRSTEASAQGDEESAVEPEVRGRGETILVVEDEPAVRELIVHMLTDLGYEIVEAGDGNAALLVLDETPGISLLFTDVILPKGMSGGELAREAQRRWPGIKVLHTSGYADNSIAHRGKINKGVDLLRKPYRKSTLARKVREVLDDDD